MKLSQSLEDSLKKDNLSDLAVNLGEVGIDAILDNGVLRDIPILSSILAGINAIGSVRDALFTRKLVAFLSELSDIPVEQRRHMIDSIDNSNDFKVKVGEKLIYIIEKAEDHYTSKIIAIFFAEFLVGEITYNQFLKISRIIDNMFIGDFLEFVNKSSQLIHFDSENTLINTGLVDVYFEPVVVEDNDDYKSYKKYVTSGGASLYITPIGELVRSVLKGKNFA
ncbi:MULTISPECIES: hypothetical protein [Aeromonas]|uniref:hypothetical protein n=1 Tax=Aeromonas TaxID=642 RepID=UPI00191F1C57|nr:MULTISPECIES: hypothetical protein [Aeromonas]KAJ8739876.1 hypothetical protein H9Y13_17795 [Aeromonas veronii]MBL0482097.1 hypothetical protein [Aeromonas veronii]MCJ7974861.1 hypothetical protein [Aeromonas veronii]MDA3316887.1 hypothetical protein [Aeromonas sp. PI_26]UOR19593.1 hypothetical protein LOS88_02545 [Aeromonas veronii]